MAQKRDAFVLRVAPARIDRMSEALDADELIIGWAEVPELLDQSLEWEQFREIIRSSYYSDAPNLRRAGSAAGHMWRFLREMKPGDLVVTPYGPDFYVSEVVGDAVHKPECVDADSAFRRPVRWLNEKQPIPRSQARSALQSRLKTQGTCAYATDLIDEIEECLRRAGRGERRSFELDLKERLQDEALREIRSGRLNDRGFEELLNALLLALGAEESTIVPRRSDKGADILATFPIAGAFRLIVAVQAKHYQPEPPVGPETVRQLTDGLEAESADLGMVVISGTFSPEAIAAAESYFEDKGIRIELVDGPQLAALVVEQGLGGLVLASKE